MEVTCNNSSCDPKKYKQSVLYYKRIIILKNLRQIVIFNGSLGVGYTRSGFSGLYRVSVLWLGFMLLKISFMKN